MKAIRSDLMAAAAKIVITGGPSAGKTTALAAIVEFCLRHGFFPLVINEAATDLIIGKFDRTKPDFQEFVMRKILFEQELRMRAIERGHFPKKPVLIFDRGLCDGRAYVSEAVFEETLARCGITLGQARDEYDGVIFLDSAAVGAEKFYTLDNNETREEGLELARELNERTKDAWMGTPHFAEVPNRPDTSFEAKIRECIGHLARILGVPEPVENERKFLLEGFDQSMLPEHAEAVRIVQTYLINYAEDGAVERLRVRGQHYGKKLDARLFHTTKSPHPDGGSYETDRLIGSDEYGSLLLREDKARRRITKIRHCFRHGGHYCELDVFNMHREGLVLLEIEVPEMDSPVTLPDFLGPLTEVTGDPAYSNYNLSLPA